MTQEDFVKYICITDWSEDISEQFEEVKVNIEGASLVRDQPIHEEGKKN